MAGTCGVCGSRLSGSGNCPNKNAHDRLQRQKRPGNQPINKNAIIGETKEQKAKRIRDQKKGKGRR